MTQAFAIVGIGCRFPGGADSPERFWTLLRDGVSAIRQAPSERFDVDRVFHPDPAHPGTMYSLYGGFLESVDMFDAPFFGLSPREASRMDPQQRLLLEVAHEAFEDAGLSIDRLAGSRAGVFVGLSTHDYGDMQLSPAYRRLIDAHTNSGIAESIAANRISYAFDLRGPSMVVDTACSSSLTAAHLALRALRSGDCDTALVGGSMLILTPEPSIGFSKASMISPDGRSSVFAAAANGYVRSEGVAAVLLRPLEAAVAEGDRIYAVLRGSAVNQDGRTNGMTVPSPEQQELMLRAALADAGLEAADIQYVEAHGTGTPVGDPIEAAAIGAVFGPGRKGDELCAIGSVKTNIGHIEAAAGMAGLIKAALALHHRALPPSLNFDEPHPDIDFEGLRLRVVTELEPWPSNGAPARTVVNSFGFGGANANVVLEEAPAAVPAPADGVPVAPQLLPLSARSPEALAQLASAYSELLGANGDRFGADCRAAAHRRGHHEHRLAVVASSPVEAAEALDAFAAGELRAGTASGRRSTQPLAFVFPGMGPQWWAMGRQLFEQDLVFRSALERCEQALTAAGCWSVIDSMLADEPSSRMADPDIAQAANFALQVALTDLLRHNGIEPDYVVGHSAGEMAAAYAAGALSLEDAALVTYHRSRLQARAAGEGTMLAAAIDEGEAVRLLAEYGDRATLAAVNAPQSVTLSGDTEILERLLTKLTERDVFARILAVDVPYHSRSMDPILDELADSLASLAPETPKVPLASPLTGKLVEGPDLDARYWCDAVRRSMRFGDAVDALLDEGCGVFLEVGPHPVLAASLRECLGARQVGGTVAPTLRRDEDEPEAMLRALGSLYAVGRSPDWEALYPGRAEHVALPMYPWQRERHWLESLAGDEASPAADPNEHPLLGRRVRAARPLWEASLGDPRLAYLDDHVVQGTSPFPGAGYVEMGLAVSRRLLGHAAPGVRNVEFRRALFLGNREEALVQLAADPDSEHFEIHSSPAKGDPSWTVHSDGTLAGGRAAKRRIDLGAARARCGPDLPREDVYLSLAERGLDYGPSFRGLDRVAAAEGEAVAEVSLELDVERYEVHPALLDSAFQLLIIAGQSLGDALPGGGFLPVRVGEVRVNRPPGSQFFAHARATWLDERFAGDIDVVDEDGAVLVEVRGLECQFLDESTAAEAVDDWLYEYRWEPVSLGEGGESVLAPVGTAELGSLAAAAKGREEELVLHDVPSEGASGQSVLVARAPERNFAPANMHWALIGEGGGLGRRLAERLELAGASCSFGSPSEAGSVSGADGIVDLRALDVVVQGRRGADSPVESQVAACAGVADLLRTLDAAGGPPPRLVLVTTGAQAVPGFELDLSPDQAVLWGLGRSLDRERDDIRCRLVDLSPNPTDDEVDQLAAELVGGLEEEEVVLRGNVRLVPRLRRLEATGDDPPARPAERGERFRAEVRTRGLLESVRLVEIEDSPLRPGEVDVAVSAAGLNFRDVMLALDLLPPLALKELKDTDRMGLECAGIVAAVGEGVDGLKAGDEVVAIGYGTFGSHVRAASEIVVPKPTDIGFADAAGIAVAFATAYVGLVRLARLTRGEKVLIHAATGGVGLAAIEVARDVGAEIYATAGSPEKREHLRTLGIEHVFDSRTLDFADEITEQTKGAGVDVVLNSLAGEAIAKGISILAPSGRFVEIGKRDIYEDRRIGLLDFRKNLSYFALDLDRLLAEQPKLVGEICREVLDKIESGGYRLPPVEVFPIDDVAGALRKVAQAKHIGKVVIQVSGEEAQIVPHRGSRARFREDGTYLVTGGLGGFGLALAGWLAQQGADTIVLAGRRGAQPDAEPAIEALRAGGARVEVIAADVVDPQAVDRLLGQIRQELPPLRGVFHAAMVIDDAPLSELDEARFRSVLEAKAGGAWNLHEGTSADPLDVFVLFSSLAGLFGNAAQANYAAANSFLDGLAHHRRALGMPALAVNWGAISDVGYVSRHEGLAPFLESQGYLGFDAGQAFSALGRLLELDLAQGTAARIDFTRLPAPLPASPRIRHLVPEAASSPGESAPDVSSVVAQLLAAPPEQAAALAGDALRSSIARVLGTDAAAIASERPLTELGLDSLMAVELIASLKADFGIELPVVRLLEGITVAALAELVLAELELRRSAAPAAPAVPTEPEPAAATNGDAVVDGDAADVYTSLDYTAWTRRQRIARGTTTGFFRATARVEAEGLEHVPRSGAAVLATNHLSMADVPVMFTLMERPVVPLVAEELRRYPWLRIALSDVANAIYVRRGEGDEEALAQALAVLRSGGMVAVGPEGRISLTGALEAGKTGAAYLATEAGVPVIPAVAWGQERLGRNLRRLRRAPVQVRFGPPLRFPAGEQKASELREHTDAIMRALARMLPEEYRGVYAGPTERVGAGLRS